MYSTRVFTVVNGLTSWDSARRGWNRLRAQMPDRFGPGQLSAFLLGLVVLYIAIASPLDSLAGLLLQVHMVQHLLLTLLMPPLLLWGTPDWLLRPMLRYPAVERAARFLTSPVVAFFLFSSVFSLWHLPSLYDLTLRHHRQYSRTWCRR